MGFAWDVFGDGGTAVRGGFGVAYNPRQNGGNTGDMQSNPPNLYQQVTRYGTTKTYLDAQGTFSPPGFSRTLNRSNKPSVAYNTSLGIQRRLPGQFVIDVSYVGSFNRHIGAITQLNDVPYGKRFEASSLDPTQARPQALPDDFLRPYQDTAVSPSSASTPTPTTTPSRRRCSAASPTASSSASSTPGRRRWTTRKTTRDQ